MRKRTATLVVLATGLAVGTCVVPISAQQETKKLSDTVDKTVDTRQATQKKQDDWSREQADLTARYKSAKAQVEYLEKQRAYEAKEARALEDGITELRRRLVESDRLNATIQDTLNAVVNRLDAWVHTDIPFLMAEREERIAELKREVVKPDLTSAEKLRRVLEGLQVEANYGNTVEVYQDHLLLNGEDVFADFMRVGRVSVFWRTPDGKRVGEYDRGKHEWVQLDGQYKRNIGLAMDMAGRLRPTEVVELPLGRIEP
jgi:Protein of unknown function (DUF3450)